MVVKLRRSEALPLILLILLNLFVATLTFKDYGFAWDEPLFYAYGDAIDYAYSVQARLSGNFDIERAYGPSATDHKYYGPAYLLLARRLVDGLRLLPVEGILRDEWWHWVNFLTFQVGVLGFYCLARRWLSRWAALTATLLFATQPVLWGHGFINPKDMPFMVFFILAVHLGLIMVDRSLALFAPIEAHPGNATPTANAPHPPRRIPWLWLALTLGLVFSFSYLLATPIYHWIRLLVESVYHASPSTWMGRLFAFLAARAGSTPVEAYIAKAWTWFLRLRSGLTWLGLPLIAWGLLAWQRPEWLHRLKQALEPLPTWPQWHIPVSDRPHLKTMWRMALPAALLLGLLTSIRVLGPLAGALVVLYFLLQSRRRYWAALLPYTLIAAVVTYATWPFLWDNPLARLIEVARYMANNPHILPVLFNGQVYFSDQLPRTYLPLLLGLTLTEPVLPLVGLGLAFGLWAAFRRQVDWRSLLVLLLWLGLPVAYVLARRPPMYDGYRHFLFIIPPLFILAGFGLQALSPLLRRLWMRIGLSALLLTSGVVALAQLHPYQYAYYNAFIGGVGGAFRRFETDYWLTCYKEIMQQVNREAQNQPTLFVLRQAPIARRYAAPGVTVQSFDPANDSTFPGSLLLLITRYNQDLQVHPQDPVRYQVGRQGAIFCVIRVVGGGATP